MLFTNNLVLKDINLDQTEKHSESRKIAEVPIRFNPIVTSYDADPNNSNLFSLSLILSSTPDVKITKSIHKSGEEITKKQDKKEEQNGRCNSTMSSRTVLVRVASQIQTW